MIDATHIKVHPQATGAVGGNPTISRTKGGSTPDGLSVRARITAGATADGTPTEEWIAGIDADGLLADRAWDTNA